MATNVEKFTKGDLGYEIVPLFDWKFGTNGERHIALGYLNSPPASYQAIDMFVVKDNRITEARAFDVNGLQVMGRESTLNDDIFEEVFERAKNSANEGLRRMTEQYGLPGGENNPVIPQNVWDRLVARFLELENRIVDGVPQLV